MVTNKKHIQGGNSGVLIIDDTIEAKPYSKESTTINYWYDHTVGKCVKGLNILSCHYDTDSSSSPIGFTMDLFSCKIIIFALKPSYE